MAGAAPIEKPIIASKMATIELEALDLIVLKSMVPVSVSKGSITL